MEQKIDDLKETVSDVKAAVKEIADDIKEHVKLEAEKYEKLDCKYSAKWVETGVIAITTALIIASIVGLFNFIIK